MPKIGIFRHFYTLSTSTRRVLSKNAIKTKHSKLTEKKDQKSAKILKNRHQIKVGKPRSQRHMSDGERQTTPVSSYKRITTKQLPQSSITLVCILTHSPFTSPMSNLSNCYVTWCSSSGADDQAARLAEVGCYHAFGRMNRPLYYHHSSCMMYLTKAHALKVSTRRSNRGRLDTWYDACKSWRNVCLCLLIYKTPAACCNVEQW